MLSDKSRIEEFAGCVTVRAERIASSVQLHRGAWPVRRWLFERWHEMMDDFGRWLRQRRRRLDSSSSQGRCQSPCRPKHSSRCIPETSVGSTLSRRFNENLHSPISGDFYVLWKWRRDVFRASARNCPAVVAHNAPNAIPAAAQLE